MRIEEFLHRIPTLSELYEVIKILADLGAEVVEITRSEEGRPIYAVRIGRGSARIAVIATQHGSEPAPALASVLFIYKLLKDELRPRIRKEDVLNSVKLVIVPLANPDGYNKLHSCLERCGAPSWSCDCVEARLTALGEDMNRDWLTLRHRATEAIHRLLNEFDPHIVLDLHEFYAVGGAPPRWAHETEGFDAYVTDTPYIGISSEIMALSRELAILAKDSIEKVSGWKTKIVRPGDGLGVYPPIYLGVHAPFEGCAKVLVETWGVGLGSYLLYERVSIHSEVITQIVRYAQNNLELLDLVKRLDVEHDRSIGSSYANVYRLRGSELDRAVELLRKHGIQVKLENNTAYVSMPQPRYNRTALILLEHKYYVNKMLGERAQTLDKLFRIEISYE